MVHDRRAGRPSRRRGHRSEVVSRFGQAAGSLAPIDAIDPVFADPHRMAREAIVPRSDGQDRMQNVVPRFTREPGTVRGTAGALGARNDEDYGDRLGLAAAQRERLEAEGTS
jgi:crotonobetainyl-CoA:carnitine CoA-transferase CaiB-like acyl-CoA transferase